MKEWQAETESLEAGGLTGLAYALIKTSVSFKVERWGWMSEGCPLTSTCTHHGRFILLPLSLSSLYFPPRTVKRDMTPSTTGSIL